MRIEVWSDIVCPWCAIGRRRLERALELEGLEAEVVHRAFELDPRRTRTEPSRDVLRHKYGAHADVDGMMRRVEELGAAEGIDLRARQALSASTFDAHRLILWAQATGKGQALLGRLLQAHFAEGADVSDRQLLAAWAAEAGLDASEAASVLASDAHADDVREDEGQARALGVGGVPFFVFDRRLALSGAQDVSVFRTALRRAADATPQPVPSPPRRQGT